MDAVSGDLLSPRELLAFRGMLAVHTEVTHALDAELRLEHDMPIATYDVLLNLTNSPDGSMRMGELADRVFFSRSGLTRLIDRLEGAGLVVRIPCAEDRRGWWAQATDEGRERFEAARPFHRRGIRAHFLSKLSDADQDLLGEIWRRVVPTAM
jgi:DNA-binding MarR family transcriptional regulator